MSLPAGTLIAERFELARVAGRGGMSVVYRARDRTTDTDVALKLTDSDGDSGIARFAREARLLANLRHPAIVRYLAHGATADGQMYIAMEWLDGVDLATLLGRSRLELGDAVELARRVADALHFAHRRGIVHRDVKPSNVFLPGGRIGDAKVLDFGVARLRHPFAFADITRTGVALGTPSYMSPEQAHGARDVGPASDVYSLGCLLFACLTRRRAFDGEEGRHERPRVSKWRADVPAPLDDLVFAMMAPEPRDRPSDASAVLVALDALGAMPTATAGGEGATLTDEEQRLHAVILAQGSDPILSRFANEFGGQLERLQNGVTGIRISARHAATDLAVRAARCALAIRAASPEIAIAIATGVETATMHESGSSAVIERAARVFVDPISDESGARPIGIDDMTAGLLDARFEIARSEGKLTLRSAHARETVARTLLGKKTSFVARAAELGTLEALFHACVEERECKVALVTAPAGIGKSRLRWELTQRLRSASPRPQVLVGHGDPLGAGAPYRILAVALRASFGVASAETPEEQRARVRRRMADDLGDDGEIDRVTELIGELISVPFPDASSVQLRAARQDAMLMGDRVRWAFERWIAAACKRAPMLLVLEDLHWGDPSTVALLDGALERLVDCSFMILAFARPDAEDLFPRLWADRGVHHIRLAPLGDKASRQLIEQVLGSDVARDRVDAIVERAAGNPFLLEEMIRAAAAGHGGALPETVLAIVQARLEKMEPDARRVLRAASIFGRRFWDGGVRALLGEEEEQRVREWLQVLIADEVVQRHVDSALGPEVDELSFRHDLVRDAAYAMLTERDRVLGHRLAAGWLERSGAREALILAEHFERGGLPKRASGYYRKAAEKALAGNDFAGAHHCAERAGRCEPDDRERGLLDLIHAEAFHWQGKFVDAARHGLAATRTLEAGTSPWYSAIGEVATASGVQGDGDRLAVLAGMVIAREGDDLGERGIAAVTRLAEQLLINGQVDRADALLELVDRRTDAFDERNPGIVARILSAKGLRACFDGDPAANLDLVCRAAERFRTAGDLRHECIKQERAGYGTMDLGDYEEAERILSHALRTAERLGLFNVAATARHNLGLTLGRLGRFEEALAMEQRAADSFAAAHNRRMHGAAHEYLALIRLEAGDARGAELDARKALALAREPSLLPLNEAESLAILARVLLRLNRAPEAFEAAERALAGLESLGGIDDGEAIIRFAYAEALEAVGRHDDARDAIAAARARLERRAARIADPHWKHSFLTHVPENAATMRR